MNETAQLAKFTAELTYDKLPPHALDFDDLHNPSIIHLATVVVPAALAVAQSQHQNGRQLITAVCAGYEAGARAGEAIIPESYFYWHTTGTAGIFGSAAAAASLLGLNAHETNMCLGSAGTQAAGLWEFLKEGAMSKALHAGKAASGGVLAAYLARNGFTAASAILEGEKGFCRALSSAPHLEKITQNLSYSDLKIQHNSFKPYACCKHAHAAVYGAQVLRGRHNIAPQRIASVQLKVNSITDYIINNPAPQNVYGCKFSIQYCVAAALVHGKLGIDEFSADVMDSPLVKELMAKITVTRDAEQEAINRADSDKLASKIIITMADGAQYAMQVDYPKGDPGNAMTWAESTEKFMQLAAPVCGTEKAQRLCALIENLEAAGDMAAEFKRIL